MSHIPCFGIDLGTSCSAIGWIEDGAPRLIPIDGRVLMPSVVSFPLDGPPLVGQPARNNLNAAPERTIVSSKRLMGADHRYEITHEGRAVTPVDVAALILTRLADAAQAETGARPERVVITVPAWFTQAQRADTRCAGELAGLDVVRIINEPTAAALAHARGNHLERCALVYDFGGGTFDVSLIEQRGDVVEVKASHGDSKLGGDDVDVLLRDRVLRKLDQTDRDLVDAIAASPGSMLRLKGALEDIKIALGVTLEETLSLPFIAVVDGEPRHLEMPIPRSELDLVVGLVLSRTVASVDQVLKDANLSARDVDDLLLVGGSTLLPQTWHALRKRYDLEGSHAIPPQLAVAIGATIQAAIIDGSRADGVLIDVAPYSLSVGVVDPRAATGLVHFVGRVITPRNAPLPSRHTEIFYTSSPEQKKFLVPVFQGAHNDPRESVFLGNIFFDNLPPAPPEVEDRAIHVELRHNLDGMVDITVSDPLSGQTTSGRVATDGTERAELRQEWIDRMIRNGVIFGDGESTESEEETANSDTPHREALDKAKKTFDGVLEARATVTADAPDNAEEIFALAQKGLEQLGVNADSDDIIETLEDLEDLLFDAGIYL